MGKMILVPLTEVALRMQMNLEMGEVAQVLESAISGAQNQVEGMLRTQLGYQEHDCLYHLDSQAFSGVRPGGFFRVEVPSYFIRQQDPVVLTVGEGPTMENPRPLDPKEYRINYDHGQILVVDKDVLDKHLRVQCATGFKGQELDEDGNVLYEADEAPGWLKEAILSCVGVVFDTSQITNRSEQASAVYHRAGNHAEDLLAPHFRKRGFILRSET